MSEALRGSDHYIIDPYAAPEAFNRDLAIAFARMVTHGHGGTFRLTRAAAQDLGTFRITRNRDEASGDCVFTVAEVGA
jgi:hypothetical protein